MINGDLNYFMEKLYYGEEVEVAYKGHMYLIQGYCQTEDNPNRLLHMEAYRLGEEFADEGYLFEIDAATPEECVSAFRKARFWDGLTFDEAEPEIEWVY